MAGDAVSRIVSVAWQVKATNPRGRAEHLRLR